jgi:hypothetical protein
MPQRFPKRARPFGELAEAVDEGTNIGDVLDNGERYDRIVLALDVHAQEVALIESDPVAVAIRRQINSG